MFEITRSWRNRSAILATAWNDWENHENFQSGKSVFWLKFELSTSWICISRALPTHRPARMQLLVHRAYDLMHKTIYFVLPSYTTLPNVTEWITNLIRIQRSRKNSIGIATGYAPDSWDLSADRNTASRQALEANQPLIQMIHFISFIHTSMALQPFVGSWPLLQFHNLLPLRYIYFVIWWTRIQYLTAGYPVWSS
jgi:hypothetical protein